MKLSILTMLLGQLFSLITPDLIKKVVSAGLDTIDELVVKSTTTIDDSLVIPIIALIRKSLEVGGNDPTVAPQSNMILTMLGHLLILITPDMVKRLVDAGLDVIEDEITKTTNAIDDTVLMPIIKLIRVAFDIPDNDPTVITTAPAAPPAA